MLFLLIRAMRVVFPGSEVYHPKLSIETFFLFRKQDILHCLTVPNSDTGKIAEENGYRLWSESNSVEDFTTALDKRIATDRKSIGERGYRFLCEHYLVQNTYAPIIKHV